MTIAGLSLFVPCVTAVYSLYSIYCLVRNYNAAKKTGVPIRILPVSPDNPLWLLLGNPLAHFIKSIFGETNLTRFGIRAWIFYDKSRAHLEIGDYFILVTPGKNWFYVCNAKTVQEIFQRRHDFPRPLELLDMLNVFGPNVSTVEGSEWRRHRKITSMPFTEQNSKLVWTESIRQAEEVLQYWGLSEFPITGTVKDMRTLSLHVLSGAGFGKFNSFKNSNEPPKPGHMLNYRDSLSLILENILLILIVGPKILTSRYRPQAWARVGHAIIDFKAYMQDMYMEERNRLDNGKAGADTIISSLVRASEAGTTSAEMASAPKSLQYPKAESNRLTETEVYGNIFVYNFAGHDTTATTLGWTLYLLAANPEVQDWMFEEINFYLPDVDSASDSYDAVYPKLKRCLAVLFEVLRLYNPLTGIIKSTGPNSQTLTSTPITIPPNTNIILNSEAIHTHPRYWGTADPLVWRPQRWILRSLDGSALDPHPTNSSSYPQTHPPNPNALNFVAPCTNFESESLYSPTPGTYIPWSDGARVCPGRKFGQVEFVAVMVMLFSRRRVEPVPRSGESIVMARNRTLETVKDSAMVLLLQMQNPESVGLKWVKR